MGKVSWISGPVIRATGVLDASMLEMVEVGNERMVGEIIGLHGETASIQVYEETSGLKPGAPVYGTGAPLSLELGPGLMGGIFDGVQRPLAALAAQSGSFIGRGVHAHALDRERTWPFKPAVQVGDTLRPGQVWGSVQETPLIEHRLLAPPGVSGVVTAIAAAGERTIEEHLLQVASPGAAQDLTMMQSWPVRQARPYARRLAPRTPLITGQRVIDTFFPLAKGGAAAIPGGFGAGKTVTQHQLAKWSDADVIVYIGCGERGNEITQVLEEFPALVDPRTGRPLMERTILIANTSNMPVAAREASVYTGITMAEYYRDMGYDVALMADSTSRWAEALREISGRLEEMPAEEGFPAYLPARLAAFYERAGQVVTLSGETGSLSIVGAVSPPGGDFSEPVVQHTKRFIRCFWALDKDLANARHFPSVNWLESYSEYLADVQGWWRDNRRLDWKSLQSEAMTILHREASLQQIVRLVGADALPDEERLVLEVARLLREGYLQQSALDEVDTYASAEKQFRMLQLIIEFYHRAKVVIDYHCPIFQIRQLPVITDLLRMKSRIANDRVAELDALEAEINRQIGALEKDYRP
ncbi:MAG: V-type ATP synthase subunit A [Chloroflexi bacterium]|nr:V-type ATP synthase subunit A [Chloroflexota bacterium]